ncbi:hypothetical protein CLF_108454 [Clonorchis sinensis]|uniref:Uncharacterized protein n=1 Tax=Clonorchis sinensis TaxID=79923 RepID=G7YI31_CLOSI|nr:hypothetical protein CLF_108454 [Clonorchis sinensis]
MLAMLLAMACLLLRPYKQYKRSVCNRSGHNKASAGREKLSKDAVKPGNHEEGRASQNPRFNAILATFGNQIGARRKYVTVRANGRMIRLQPDTASDITIVSGPTWRKIRSLKLRPTMNTARNALGGMLQLPGEFDGEMGVAGRRDRGIFYPVACRLNLLDKD